MDYIYSNINNNLIDDSSDIEVTWTAYSTLPTASSLNYMTFAVVTTNGSDAVYLCIKQGNVYTWKLICRASGQLGAPTITLSGSTVSWAAISDAVSYDVYKTDTLLTNVTTTSCDLSNLIDDAGTYRIQVVAKAAAGSEFADSEKSNYVEYTVMPKYFMFVNEEALTSIPESATKASLPTDYATNGWTVHYTTVGEQYEYLAYPATINALVDVVQSGQHVLGNYTKLGNTTKGGIEYHLYRTTLQQVYDDSDYSYYTFRVN